jgi:hypothetical protein
MRFFGFLQPTQTAKSAQVWRSTSNGMRSRKEACMSKAYQRGSVRTAVHLRGGDDWRALSSSRKDGTGTLMAGDFPTKTGNAHLCLFSEIFTVPSKWPMQKC